MNTIGKVNQRREHPAQAVEAAPPACTSGSGAYQLDPDAAQVVTPDGRRVQLSPVERDVLHVLHMLRGRWVGAPDILAIVWDGCIGRNSLNVQINHIRRKCGPDVIETNRWLGYGVGVR